MRVEDLDAARTRPEAVMGNLAELGWLGLDWDEGPDVGGASGPYLQSRRGRSYVEALERLGAGGRLAESFLSRREVAELAAAAAGDGHGGPAGEVAGEAAAGAGGRAAGGGAEEEPSEADTGLGPVYGPAHRRLDEALAASRRAAGRRASLRFVAPPGVVAFDDAIAGPQAFDAKREVGDFVVRRADGLIAYQLAVVVDDSAMGISEVARGADLLASTAAQLLLYAALDLPAPRFAHVGLLLDSRAQKLAKRHGATSLYELRRAGVPASRVLGLLAHTLQWLPEPRELGAAELLERLAGEGGKAGADAGGHEAHPLAAPHRLSVADLAWLGG